MKLILIYVIAVNVMAFIVYGMDKWKAQRGKRRVPEKTLLFLAGIGGSIGAYVGMMFFRHKTRKAKFILGVPVIILFQAGLVFLISRLF